MNNNNNIFQHHKLTMIIKNTSLLIFKAYIADVVGIALGLEELGYIRVQRVLLVNFLQTFLVEDLQSKV